MKRLFAVLLLIFTLGALSVYAEEEIKFDAVIYVGTGEGITNGKGETPETACATLDKAVGRFVPGKENYHIILVGDTVFEHEMQIKKKYVYISGNGVITPKIIGTFSGRTRDGEAYMFDVSEKSTLVLGGEDSNIVIDGCAYESEYEFGSVNYRGPDNCYINNNGTLILRDGVSIQNINVVHPGEYSRQGYIQANNKRAIAVGNSGTAEMDGGVISECGPGYSVSNRYGAVFNFNGGKITDTKGIAAVYNKGEFNLNGGEISHKYMVIINDGTLNMNRGKVITKAEETALKGSGDYTKSDEVIIEGKIYNKDRKLVTAEPTSAPKYETEATSAPEKTAAPEPAPVPAAGPELEAPDENDTIPVYVDRRKIKFTDAYPFIDESSRTQLPVRAVADMLGCEVSWDGAKRLVTLKKDDITAELTIGADRIIVNGNPVVMDTAARIENDRTYIPGRYIGEALGYSVEWIDGCVFINSLK